MHERLAVYVPNPDASERAGLSVRSIDPKSAIVGVPLGDRSIHIYYEGNRHGASNMDTFADRAYFAASRLSQRYPTVAQTIVRPRAIERVGWYYRDQQRIEVEGGLALTLLAKWLGVFDEGHNTIDSDALARELVETRATPARYRGQRVHVTPQDRARLTQQGVQLEDA